MARQFRGDIDIYVRDFMHLVEAWNAGLLHLCRPLSPASTPGAVSALQGGCRKADVPLLIFEFDMFDPRVTPYADVYFEVERFVNEVVWPRKQREKGAA